MDYYRFQLYKSIKYKYLIFDIVGATLNLQKTVRSFWMKKKKIILELLTFLVILLVTGCGTTGEDQMGNDSIETTEEEVNFVTLTSEIVELEEDFFAVRYDGDYGFDKFLDQGGASSDAEVAEFLINNFLSGTNFNFLGDMFGCSTLSVQTPEGEFLFGRNFDWEGCEAMVLASYPENGYASISTVNTDFIRQGIRGVASLALQMDTVKIMAGLYAPLDGMNEKGLTVSVNMIQDSSSIEQDTEKPDITTTTAIRLLLNKAANVEEALELLGQYDLHASMDRMVHFALADTTGRSVVVEYVENEMVVTDTPVVTNFYFAEGEKNGIGTKQSHERYDILMEQLERTMRVEDVRDALNRVSKDNFGEFESTEWSIVFNQSRKEARYYHRENYEKSYTFVLE